MTGDLQDFPSLRQEGFIKPSSGFNKPGPGRPKKLSTWEVLAYQEYGWTGAQVRRWMNRRRDRHVGSTGFSRELLITIGWETEAMAHSFIHSLLHNRCPGGCGRRLSELPSSDITIDIRERSAPPVWGANTQWMCRPCNSRKHTDTLESHLLDLGARLVRAELTRRGDGASAYLFEAHIDGTPSLFGGFR